MLIFRVTYGKDLPRDASEGGSRVCGEDVNLIPVIRDHEESGTGSPCRTQARAR